MSETTNNIPEIISNVDENGNPTDEKISVRAEYGSNRIDPEEGTMIISNRLDFKVDGYIYQISTDGCMTSDQIITYDPHGQLPNILKPYAAEIDKFVSEHCGTKKKIWFRQFIFVGDDAFKTFIMVDTNLNDPDVRPYDSINMLAAYLGTYPEDWGIFCDHIIDGDVFTDKIFEVRQNRKGGYKRAPEYKRYLLFLCDEKEYNSEEFNPVHLDRACNFFYVNRHDMHDALHSDDEPECPDYEWPDSLDESEADDDRNDGIIDPEE